MKKSMRLVFALAVICPVLAAGCQYKNVYLQQNNYVPGFQAEDFKEYKEKSIYLPPFINRAENTSIWNFYSNSDRIAYKTENIERFFWTCFQEAFLHIGAFVYESLYPGYSSVNEAKIREDVKEFRIQLNSITDTELRFLVTLFEKGNIVFQKKFIIPMPSVETEDKAQLQQRIFQMIDKSVTAILKDPDFKGAFLGQPVTYPEMKEEGDPQ